METLTIILLAGVTMLALAVLMSFILGWANRAFHVQVNPLVEKAMEILPGTNCGGCGYVGCSEYAEAVVSGEAPPGLCPVGGHSVAEQLADLLGISFEQSHPKYAIVHCGATPEQKKGLADYRGEPTCAAANVTGGVQACAYGCLGMGDCVRSCRFDAIHVIDGLAAVDYHKCTGCGACVRACPRDIISLAPFQTDRMITVACSNRDFGKDVKAVCDVGCIGCKACTRVSDLFHMDGQLSRIDYEQYTLEKVPDGEQAIEKCPTDCIVYRGKGVESSAPGSDEAAESIPAGA